MSPICRIYGFSVLSWAIDVCEQLGYLGVDRFYEVSGMAKAQVTTPAGISVKVEGTPEEILAVVQDLERKEESTRSARGGDDAKRASGRLTLTSLFESLRDEGFFKEPRDLGSIKAELDAKGHFFPVTTLSGAVLGQVRKKNLRRLKMDGRWSYVRVG